MTYEELKAAYEAAVQKCSELEKENDELKKSNEDQALHIEHLEEQILKRNKMLFGQKSEKSKFICNGQMNLDGNVFNEAEELSNLSAAEPTEDSITKKSKKTGKHRGRNELRGDLETKEIVHTLPEDQRSNFGTITPIAAMFKNIGGVAFGLMLPVLAGFIGMAIGDRPALALGFVGGMLAANGKSGFLGALVAGFLAGYLIVGLRKICDKLPDAVEKLAPVLIYPVVGILIMGLAMNFVVEPIMGGINTGLNNFLSGMGDSSRVVLGLILGGMMAIDMGGPFNKAAYVFGTAAIAAGNYDIMAAVMIGGMTPPCAIALATLLFKNKFTKEERDAGPTNFIMGLAFITEGAIPFAASDPLHVLPSCIIGSALAGALSMAFHCTLMAPHGGIFVFPVVGNAVMYLVALVAGTVVSALLLGVLKKKVTT